MKPTGFEMPPELRAIAEQGIETARKAFQGYLDATEKALSAFETTTGASAAAREVSRKAMSFAQENLIDNFAFIDKLMRVRDLEELVRLQTEFAQKQAEKLSSQTQALSEAASRAMRTQEGGGKSGQ